VSASSFGLRVELVGAFVEYPPFGEVEPQGSVSRILVLALRFAGS
jgi:hypothetical protein